ncbi:hypothetical protein O6P37_18045 [Mycobacterium sp. CPCC 205372]|uniref:Uncharacterized protein n=1 Tax=Mycobacterium hippophais TaxID=3016340 RepID=A0ABT4PW90_9MYCO|nr:hypothetical protein [Mycobacterium hippophais]MCZ8380773.1 hypothetical protein [Mycobacterium hippophais]
MGGHTEVDPGRLRASADSVRRAADELGGFRWPTLDVEALRGSDVGQSAVPAVLAARAAGLVTALRDWADAAVAAAAAFERAEQGSAGRFGR